MLTLGIRVWLVRRRTVVGASVGVLLSFMPAMSNTVGFAQEQPQLTVRSDQAQPVANDLLRVPGVWVTGSMKLTTGATLTLAFQDDGYHWIFDGAGGQIWYNDRIDPLLGGPVSNTILEVDA